jgi:RNA polymerase II subunit A small phosphatase-like protein
MDILEKKLLILDLDETLIYATETPLERPPDFRVGPYAVYRRPHVAPFLAQCREWFEVAVWSSSSPLYAREVVHALFQEPSQLAFVWARDRCTACFDHELREHCWRKPLSKVKRRGYAPAHIIAVDDSPEKWSRSYGNLVRVMPYCGAVEDDELNRLLPFLDWLRTVPNVRAVEKRLWRIHKSGQGMLE